jgi:hypothetical protein
MASEAIYGLLAAFKEPQELLAATLRAKAAGYHQMDAFSPFPVKGVAEALGFTQTAMPFWTLVGGLCGGIGGFSLQWYASVFSYPTNVGGRPLDSWPAFIPITFELAILFAAFGAVFSMLWANGLPKPYHPMFNAVGFQFATRDRFFLLIRSNDPRFEREGTMNFLKSLTPWETSEVTL